MASCGLHSIHYLVDLALKKGDKMHHIRQLLVNQTTGRIPLDSNLLISLFNCLEEGMCCNFVFYLKN